MLQSSRNSSERVKRRDDARVLDQQLSKLQFDQLEQYQQHVNNGGSSGVDLSAQFTPLQ